MFGGAIFFLIFDINQEEQLYIHFSKNSTMRMVLASG